MRAADTTNTFEGVITGVVYKNDENGYAVLEVTDDDGSELTAVGILSLFEPGERVCMRGEYVEHPVYGEQMKVEHCETILPTDLVGIERYLGSGLVKGIGPATAKSIVYHFGKDTLDIMLYAPHRLEEIPGIGAVKCAKIAESFRAQQQMRDTMVFLQGHGVSPLFSVKIYKQYGEAAKTLIQDNPYRLADEIDGIGFLTADRIGRNLGIAEDDDRRMTAGLVFALVRAMDSGHVCLPQDQLLREAMRLLQVDEAPLERALSMMLITGSLVQQLMGDQVYIYRPVMLESERYVAQRLVEIARQGQDYVRDAAIRIESAERKLGIELAPAQRVAVEKALSSPLCVITGGPGTGKTTILRVVLEVLESIDQIPALAAPTGRAAKRMQEATGYEARTVHRLLEYMNGDGGNAYFNRNEDNPIDADVVIVDECSMVDLFLMHRLLRALPHGARLVLVGDRDQLPSVGPGNVLRDIIESGAADCTMLTEIFRQAQESLIVVNAHRINDGEYPELFNRKSDFFFERQNNASAAAQSVVELCRKRLPGFVGLDVFSGIQVLAPMKKGEVGVNNLNLLLQAALNPSSFGKNELKVGTTTFREGDKVMQTKNNYKIEWMRGSDFGEGVFNGDMGVIRSIDTEAKTLVVVLDDGREVEYAFEDCDQLDMAYAISVHKSQGSEYPVVVMPICGGAPMLMTRNLLYTALTRAKRMVMLVGSERSICAMVDNDRIDTRYGCLKQRLQEEQE
ncbi:MAG: ATP-dependent RecD-like DNA helicase [Clostridia bacterium]|nr:ATP-dependent RecD-like DNA helicase [Clostridia bacterium]